MKKKCLIIVLVMSASFRISGMDFPCIVLPYIMAEFGDDDEPAWRRPHEPSCIEKKIYACLRALTGNISRYITELGDNLDYIEDADWWPITEDDQ